MDTDNIINKIKQIMLRRKVNQTKLAQAAGITNKTVGRWLKGEIIPSENSLKKIAEAHNISLRWLCDEKYNGPMNANAEWAYDAKQNERSLHASSKIYNRIDEIMSALDLNPARLIAIAGINVTMEKEPYFLGSPPRPKDVEKISKATGYNKTWIWYGHGTRVDKYLKRKHPILSVAQPEADYDEHGGWTPQTKKTDWGCLNKVAEIVDSDTIYSKALLQNIDAFYQAVMAGKDRRKAERRERDAGYDDGERRVGERRRKTASGE